MHRFEGATMRDAIAKVKAELGDQAVIISTRQIRRGLLGTAVEISAAIDDGDDRANGPTSGGPMPGPPAAPGPDVEKLIGPIRTEMRSLRAMVRTAGDNRGTSDLRNEVIALRKLVEELASRKPEPAARPARASTALIDQAIDDIDEPVAPARRPRARTVAQHAVSIDAPLTAPTTGKILMLVGPTGAGKTTTIAKLAANAALVEGKRVQLITLDNYRVGGVDQIRTFADLIGVPLQVAESPAALVELIDERYDLTLIDTAGRSPRDTASIVELAGELANLPPIEVHIVVPAAASPAAIDELANRYRSLHPARLLFTKLDEIEQAPELAHAPARTELPITWVTTGQAVPEDIEQPTSARVLELASRGLSTSNRRVA
jgi:flagellar biosynthesis protein FlhF